MVVQAATATFESIQIGDELPVVTKPETQETINEYWRLAQDRRKGWTSLHTNEEYAKAGIFAGTVNMGVVTVAYFAELLQKALPARALYSPHARVEMRATEPIRAGDTVTLTGKVTGKRVEGGARLVECELTAVNQLGQTVGVARATLVL